MYYILFSIQTVNLFFPTLYAIECLLFKNSRFWKFRKISELLKPRLWAASRNKLSRTCKGIWVSCFYHSNPELFSKKYRENMTQFAQLLNVRPMLRTPSTWTASFFMTFAHLGSASSFCPPPNGRQQASYSKLLTFPQIILFSMILHKLLHFLKALFFYNVRRSLLLLDVFLVRITMK